MTTRAPIGRLFGVVVGAAAIDQGAKLLVRQTLAVGDHQHLVLGFGLAHIQRTSVRSITITLVVASVLVIAALVGWAWRAGHPQPIRSTWLAGGLLVGGAASSFLERASSGSTTEWLSLPVGPVISLAYIEMLAGASALFFVVGASRRRPQPRTVSRGSD